MGTRSQQDSPPALNNVAILLCTRNGGSFLEEQLESFRRQTHANWQLYISDDHSTDDTVEIIKRFAATVSNPVDLRYGAGQGYVQNFLSLVVDPAIKAQYFAYSDQDDIWLPDKLARAVAWHASVLHDQPALYCSRVQLITSDGADIGLSPLFSKPPSFRNALMENIAGGNASVFNSAARNVLIRAGKLPVTAHDWWTYQLISGCGGVVGYDPHPCLKYRQHKENIIGSNRGLAAGIKHMRRLWLGEYQSNITRNLNALEKLDYLTHPETKKVMALFKKVRTGALVPRLIWLRKSGIYRQSLLGNVGLVVAALFKKL